jgi:hypothetical protein
MFWERDADRRTEAQAGVPAGRGAGGSRIYCITVPLLLRPLTWRASFSCVRCAPSVVDSYVSLILQRPCILLDTW